MNNWQENERIQQYLELLVKWNQKFNLVGFNDPQDILNYLIADSWHLFLFISQLNLKPELTFVDLGAGAGLPGIPFRIFWPKGKYYLVEIRKKRVAFLRLAVAKLELNNTFVLDQDVQKLKLRADVIVARAFKPYLEVLKLSLPIIKSGRVIIAAKRKTPPHIPQGWQLETSYSYPIAKEERYFWSFKPIS